MFLAQRPESQKDCNKQYFMLENAHECAHIKRTVVKTGPEDVFEKVFTEDVFATKDSRCKTLFPRKML